MSTGDINLDILLRSIQNDAISGSSDSIEQIRKRYPTLSEKEAAEIQTLVMDAASSPANVDASLVLTAPPSFSIKAKSTRNTVESMIRNAKSSILITGYSLSDYFANLIETIIAKSQEGVFVKFFVNNIEDQACFAKLVRYKGRFLKIYNYPKQTDKMSALHAKVISVDRKTTLITSANLSYHGQEGNIELGTCVDSTDIAMRVDEIFTHLIFSKVFIEQ